MIYILLPEFDTLAYKKTENEHDIKPYQIIFFIILENLPRIKL